MKKLKAVNLCLSPSGEFFLASSTNEREESTLDEEDELYLCWIDPIYLKPSSPRYGVRYVVFYDDSTQQPVGVPVEYFRGLYENVISERHLLKGIMTMGIDVGEKNRRERAVDAPIEQKHLPESVSWVINVASIATVIACLYVLYHAF